MGQIISKWLKGTSSKQEKLVPPPSYESLSAQARFTMNNYYRQRAMNIVAQHKSLGQWFIGIDYTPPIVKDIISFANGNGLSINSQEYVYETLDEIRTVMIFFDFLVDAVDLRHADGANNCESWFLNMGRYSEEAINQIMILVSSLINNTLLGAPVPGGWVPFLPYTYLAICLYETYPALPPFWVNRMMNKLELLDKRFALLVDCNFHDTKEYVTKKGEERRNDDLVRFEGLFSEIKRRNGDFQDFHHCAEPFKKRLKKLGKSDAFVDKLFGSTIKEGASEV